MNELIEAGVDKFSATQHGKSMSQGMKQIFQESQHNKKIKKTIKYNIFEADTPLYNRGGLVQPEQVNAVPRCIDPGNPVSIDHAEM